MFDILVLDIDNGYIMMFLKNNIDKIYIFKGERKYNYGLITGREISYFGYRRNNKNEQRLCFNNSINARNQLYCYAINL